MEGGERGQKGANHRNVGSRKVRRNEEDTGKKLERQTRNERRREGRMRQTDNSSSSYTHATYSMVLFRRQLNTN